MENRPGLELQSRPMGINVASWSEDWYICILIEKIVHIVVSWSKYARNSGEPNDPTRSAFNDQFCLDAESAFR